MNPQGALRSGAALGAGRMGTAQDVHEQERQREAAEYRDLMEVASLANHPGWKRVQTQFEDEINRQRSGKAIQVGIQNGQLSNERLGEEVRIAYRLAEKLEAVLAQVTLKAQQYEERRQKRASERVRPQK